MVAPFSSKGVLDVGEVAVEVFGGFSSEAFLDCVYNSSEVIRGSEATFLDGMEVCPVYDWLGPGDVFTYCENFFESSELSEFS